MLRALWQRNWAYKEDPRTCRPPTSTSASSLVTLVNHSIGMTTSEVEVGPTEETVLALLELLVDPLLPSKSYSREIPSPCQEESVAKQMHAVVLLYNYYHRKRHRELEFLEFDSFCKLAVVFRPNLLPYLKLMRVAKYDELDDVEGQLSLTEKMIMDACDISKSLDSSKDVPITEGWPITKLAIFLVDNWKENCFLLHSAITQGVWSLIEKDLNALDQSTEHMSGARLVKKRITKKLQKENQNADETAMQQLAFTIVNNACGFSQNELKILEGHVVYSLSKEKTTTHLYIMQCTQSNQDADMVPIKDAVDSLRGPLVRMESGSWIATAVVEYFHMLPYVDIVSDWLSREAPPKTSPHCETGLKEEKHESSCGMVEPLVYKKRNMLQKSNLTVDLGSKSSNVNTENSVQENTAFAVTALSDNTDVHESAMVCSPADRKSRNFADIERADVQVIPAESDILAKAVGAIVPAEITGKTAGIYNQFIVDSSENISEAIFINQHGKQNRDLLVYDSNTKHVDKVQLTIASKDNLLSQTALKVLVRKREMLSQQLRNIEDELAVCDQNIQTILSGGENDLAIKLDSIIEGCNEVYLRTDAASLNFQDQDFLQYLKRKRLSEANLCMQNPCQVLALPLIGEHQ
ncbi:hypothetical protein Nepgr_010510 [Nepenthes gracilis]|uniref:Uncharacterized protein n=1 Tax=Nepenthes gracilis TaxID=150966 RepID=A0AAD3XLE0_NEPGR|nr:hypothetical protein Nepgr_010510 [Nepenthes gracilis]